VLPFLLEIGTEEIPDRMLPEAVAQLRELFEKLLAENKLGGEVSLAEGTPRRLVLMAENIAARQPDSEDIIMGPPIAAGEAAVAGFAKRLGVDPSALERVQTPRGEYRAFRRRVRGRGAVEIFKEFLPGLILSISFPKTMYWTEKAGPRFVRPIRWIVALLGARIIPFEIAGVRSSNASSGHRQLGKAKVRVTIDTYLQALRDNFVLVSAQERRSRIKAGLEKAKPDLELLERLVYLTEYPTAVEGSFAPEFLALPEEVLITVMRRHQKYFSVLEPDGRLAPRFIMVMNTVEDPDGLVRRGNERVLRARFNDARFFWEFDQRKKLAERVEDLKHVTFQAQLGSYFEKTSRMVELVRELGGSELAERAALLAKCDLTTEMVKEFTELQGVIGGLYAKSQGEPEAVWRAIYEHYQPVNIEDSIPSTLEGCLVSLADKLDTLRGCFAIGLVPSGSKDPFALRRAAQGAVKILVEGRLSLPVSRLIGPSEQLAEFFLDRVRYYFRDVRGFRYDEVNAVLASGWDDLPDVESRLLALQAVRPTENFEPLAASFKRIRNILKQAQFTGGVEIDGALFEEDAEQTLYEHYVAVRDAVQAGGMDYVRKLERIASLRPAVDQFFDKVLVNAPDEKVRFNRLALLHGLLSEFSTIADFSEIVTQ
jgi:glycyl-tRNA synthetase beta chain